MSLSPKDQSLIADVLHLRSPGQAPVTLHDGQKETFYYVNNPDGSIRWFFPANATYPAYLGLYNSGGWKAQLYRSGTQAAFGLGLVRKWVSGEWSCDPDTYALQQVLDNVPHDTWAAFTGTAGSNRKSVVAIAKGGQITHYLKIAHSSQAQTLIRQEQAALDTLRQKGIQAFSFPATVPGTAPQLLIQTHIRPQNVRANMVFTPVHAEAIAALTTARPQQVRISDSPFFQEIQSNLRFISQPDTFHNDLDPALLSDTLRLLQEQVFCFGSNPSFTCGPAHGDFTPWNQFFDGQRLYLYDWELFGAQYPALYDLFHFIYQTGGLLRRHSYPRIREEIDRALRLPAIQGLCANLGIRPELTHQLYLSHISSYYLRIYAAETRVLAQAHQMLRLWHQALSENL
ncbi:MAG: hypothetical protein EAZ89_17535 [Bacteroidetes bacterium]|nr:MAG: hypothetical protein EAZ89_17535 [Bacteroidota bacterium]